MMNEDRTDENTSGQQSEPQAESENEQRPTAEASGEQVVEELGRLGRKFVEVVELAWTSDQRRQIEQDLRSGLTTVVTSLESGLQDLGEKQETQEFVDRAEDFADNVAEKVKTSELANELARTLARGLHAMADQLDRLAREMQAGRPAREQAESPQRDKTESSGHDIQIIELPPDTPDV